MRSIAKAVVVAGALALGSGQAQAGGLSGAVTAGGIASVMTYIPIVGAVVVVSQALLISHQNKVQQEAAAAKPATMRMEVTKTLMDGTRIVEAPIHFRLD